MNDQTRSSIYVAPLHITKDVAEPPETCDTKDTGYEHSGDISHIHRHVSDAEPSGFHTYLRACFSYHPTGDDGSSTVTLPLSRGDVILIHSVHTNGWADGTLLPSGARGWLPTNYCEAYDSQPIRNLMKAMTRFWDLIKCASTSSLEVLGNHEYVRGLVAGVRCLLERTDCLNRDTPLIQFHSGLRRNRKALLSDLSSVVKTAKSVESAVKENAEVQIEDVVCDELITKAFKAVTRAVKFLDIWVEVVASGESTDVCTYNEVPTGQAPSAEKSEFGCVDDCLQEPLVPAPLTTRPINQQAISNEANRATADDSKGREQTDSRPCFSRSSFTYMRHSVSSSIRKKDSSNFIYNNINSATHRSTSSIHASGASRLNLASIKLSVAHDLFLGCLGSFIGLHLESRSSSQLLTTTHQAVISCRNMLKIIEAIWDRDSQRSDSLAQARENMYSSITELAEATRSSFTPSQSGDAFDIHMISSEKPMVDAATACVRAAGECVAESQFVLDRLGDFHFEPLQLDYLAVEDGFAPPESSEPQENTDQDDTQWADETLRPCEPLRTPPSLPIEDIIQPTVARLSDSIESNDVALDAGDRQLRVRTHSLLPPLPPFAGLLHSSDDSMSANHGETQSNSSVHLRADSFDCPSAGGSSTFVGSMQDSETTAASGSSTRATSPDVPGPDNFEISLGSKLSFSQSTLNDDAEEAEAAIEQKTFAHEIIYNKEGQISGGTLPALIEKLTTHDSTPDVTFVATFYLTFRLFATPVEFAQALVDRFSYVAESSRTAGPIRLRVYNAFKGWLESHWRNDCDNPALELIHSFATRQLHLVLPTAGKRLAHLVEKVNAAEGPLVPRLLSSMGKTNTCIATYVPPDTPLPAPLITKGQLTALKTWRNGGANVSILDFDPLELARQFTIKESRIFCSILPEELLATEWTKKTGSMAVNVRAMSTLSTDLANLVADSILQPADLKVRAKIIKRWVKIASKCLDLANYDSLMAIICSLNSSTILRLKRTWDQVSYKTKATLETIKGIVDCSRNYAVLRQRLQNTSTPCLPFVGTYLTDLTFVDVGNQTTRHLNSEGVEDGVAVINFDKHVKTAKIISELQRFQIPYRFAEIPELQTWMQDQLVRVRSSDQSNLQSYYRRSLLLEPRDAPPKLTATESQSSSNPLSKEKFEFFNWVHKSTETPAITPL